MNGNLQSADSGQIEGAMKVVPTEKIYEGKKYLVDSGGYLIMPSQWDEKFARGVALELEIAGGLNERHWAVIRYIHAKTRESGKCPTIYQTCEDNNLRLEEMRDLFPTGYLRGACRISGMTFKEVGRLCGSARHVHEEVIDRIYEVDMCGFLIHAGQWDENYASQKASEMKMPVPLGERQWKIIYFLRDRYNHDGKIPTVYETCEANGLDLYELAELFPDGYNRGAVKLAGLKPR